MNIKTIKDFIASVKDMRELQKTYFYTHNKDILVMSKQKEKEVDAAINDLEEKVVYGQQELF